MTINTKYHVRTIGRSVIPIQTNFRFLKVTYNYVDIATAGCSATNQQTRYTYLRFYKAENCKNGKLPYVITRLEIRLAS
jgi:hypothetical protein